MTNDFDSLPSSSTKVLKYWRGLGAWNIYFILKLALLWYGYLNYHALENLIFLAFLLFPLPFDRLHKLRQLIAIPIGFALFWHDTWLPGPDSIISQRSQIEDFSWNYIFVLTERFINWEMIGVGLILIVGYLFISQWIRITVFVVLAIVWLNVNTIVAPLISLFPSAATPAPQAAATNNTPSENKTNSGSQLDETLPANTENLNAYLLDFYQNEKSRTVKFVDSLPADAQSFDILIINVCSLSWSDIELVNLDKHPLWQKFDIIFDSFNSATSYSGPAAIRLLRAGCGQISHEDLYVPVQQNCYLFDNLARLGFSGQLMLDHSGNYGSYLNNLRSYADMQMPVESKEGLTYELVSFNGEPIYSESQILARWLQEREKAGDARNATFFNTIPLHDGVRFANQKTPANYQPRAQKLLDNLDSFLTELEKSGRKVMVLIIPEHGAALKGDKMQMSGLRDIPSPSITHVPVGIKFVGMKAPKMGGVERIKERSSYLAVAEIISRVVDGKIFVNDNVDWSALVLNLPQTPVVSENSNAVVINYQDKNYVRLSGGDWVPYPAD